MQAEYEYELVGCRVKEPQNMSCWAWVAEYKRYYLLHKKTICRVRLCYAELRFVIYRNYWLWFEEDFLDSFEIRDVERDLQSAIHEMPSTISWVWIRNTISWVWLAEYDLVNGDREMYIPKSSISSVLIRLYKLICHETPTYQKSKYI